MTTCLIENRVETVTYAYAPLRGWCDLPDGFELRERVRAEDVQAANCYALMDSIDALSLAGTHTVLTDIGLVSLHSGGTAMYCATRPDEVEQAQVALGESSRASEALARATVHHFFGIDVIDWARAGGSADVTILDGADAFRLPESGHLEDLVRAWFILTSLPFASHVFIAPNDRVASDHADVRRVVGALHTCRDAFESHRREVRRNLATDLGLDRERLTSFLQDQRPRLTNSGRKGWLDLSRRVASAMNLPRDPVPDIVSIDRTLDD